MNSVNESLYYCVPLIMYPQTTEQDGVANRVAELDAGIFLESGTGSNHTGYFSSAGRKPVPSPAQIRSAVDKILQNNSYHQNASAISDGFRNCAGAEGSAKKILEVIAGCHTTEP